MLLELFMAVVSIIQLCYQKKFINVSTIFFVRHICAVPPVLRVSFSEIYVHNLKGLNCILFLLYMFFPSVLAFNQQTNGNIFD